MNKRPKIKLKLTKTDKILETIGWTVLFGMWFFILTNYSELSDKIATHYNIFGEADSYGKKGTIFFLPIISTILFVGLTVLTKYPHIYNNYPIEITKENAKFQYKNATRMIRLLKLAILIIFGLIVFKTIQNVNGNSNGIGVWFLPLTFGLIFIPMAYYLTKSIRNNKKNTGYNNV